MKRFVRCFCRVINSQSFAAAIALSVIAIVSLACRLGDYLPANNSSTANSSTTNASGKTASQTNSLASNNAAQDFCQNAYYPIGAEVERKYRIVYQGNSLSPKEYTQTYTDVTTDKFTEHNKFTDVQNALNFKCTAEGLQGLQYDNGNTVSTVNNMRGKLKTIKAEGLTFPAEARWQPGEKWTGNYQVRWEIQAGSGAPNTANATVEGKSEIIGAESVTVPAGTFDCLKVHHTITLRFASMKVGNLTVPINQPITITTDAYYAKNVGMVKSIVAGTMGGATTELISTHGSNQ